MFWTSWILKAEPFAYSQLQLKPEEFWSLTPGKFNEIVTGYYRRVRREREVTAQWICVLVNHFPMRGKSANTLRVEQLVGPSEETLKAVALARAKAKASKRDT